MTSKKVKKTVTQENTIEDLIDNMNYVGQVVVPLFETKLKEVKMAVNCALEQKVKMPKNVEKTIDQTIIHANQLLAIILSTYDGNRHQNYLYQTVKGLGTAVESEEVGDIVTMHVVTGQNPCMTEEQQSMLTTKTDFPTFSVHYEMYNFLLLQFMPIREMYYSYYGITKVSHTAECFLFSTTLENKQLK